MVDPDDPPPAARTIEGTQAIRTWLNQAATFGIEVSHLVDGGDRVAFTEYWKRRDGSTVVATSTAELPTG